MLPFLKPKKQATVTTSSLKLPETIEENDSHDDMGGLEACAQDIIRAVNDGDPKTLAHALQAAFDVWSLNPPEPIDITEE